ncbi:MAG: hypothetical protein LBP68_08805 [Acidobacteriota bacterium]|nr:hypothetical protein [Acidobacteriota bacterium]
MTQEDFQNAGQNCCLASVTSGQIQPACRPAIKGIPLDALLAFPRCEQKLHTLIAIQVYQFTQSRHRVCSTMTA